MEKFKIIKISLITVNYNTEECIAKLLCSLNQQTMNPDDFEFIVVNNIQSSKLEEICNKLQCKFKLRIIQSPQNVGFGRGNNLGAKHAEGEYLLLINPDVLVPQSDFLEQLYHFAKLHPQHGIISTRVINDDGKDSGPYYEYAYGIKYDLPGKIASVIGALMLISKPVYESVNGFDPDFFMYDEENDLCLRIREQGFSIYQINELVVEHVGGVSEPTREKEYWVKRQRGYYLFCYKHYSKELFAKILKEDKANSFRKIISLWLQINLLQIRRKRVKYERWSAIYECANRTQNSVDLLFYK